MPEKHREYVEFEIQKLSIKLNLMDLITHSIPVDLQDFQLLIKPCKG